MSNLPPGVKALATGGASLAFPNLLGSKAATPPSPAAKPAPTAPTPAAVVQRQQKLRQQASGAGYALSGNAAGLGFQGSAKKTLLGG